MASNQRIVELSGSSVTLTYEGNMFDLAPAERMFIVRLCALCDEMDAANTLAACNKINAQSEAEKATK